MLDLGLIDEVSMMYGYGGREGMAAAFDGRPKKRKPIRLKFKSVEEQDGIVWMRYQVENNKNDLTNAASLDGLAKGTYIVTGEKRIIE